MGDVDINSTFIVIGSRFNELCIFNGRDIMSGTSLNSYNKISRSFDHCYSILWI